MMNYFKVLVIFIFVVLSCKEKDTAIINSIKSPTSLGSMQPFLFSNGKELLMSWTQAINDSVYALRFSTLTNGVWENPIEIARGKDWFVNWADFPAIAINNKNIATHFLQKSDPATFAYDIHLKLSTNTGRNWKNNFLLHTDSTKTEHGFVSLLPYKKDSFFATWLDGRNAQGKRHQKTHKTNGAMNVRTAIVTASGKITNDTLVDDKTCDCCQTSAAITLKGPIIVYRNRTDDEERDIYISRFLDGNWTIPRPVFEDHWKIKGCPVNGPKATVFKNTLAVAWFTAANNKPKVKLVFSKDSGAHFEAPIIIDDSKPMGRVAVVLLDEQNVLISWMASTDDAAEIKAMRVNRDGTKQKPVTIAVLSASRKSGFPQLALVNNTAYFAWNALENEQAIIKMKSIPIAQFSQ